MNQILDTGDEKFQNNNIKYEVYNSKTKKQPNHEKSVIEINKIVIFFAISILILGICIIAGSIYAKDKINKNVEENATPIVNFDFNEENSSVDIFAHHTKGIVQISYKVNDNDEEIIEGDNQQDIKTTVKLDGGKNKIVVKAIDTMNHLVEYEREYTVGNLAQIALENIDNAVKMTVTSTEKIKTITYNWDDGENTIINVGSLEYSNQITAPKGRHTLKIVVLDEKNVKTEKTQVVIGATAPKIDVALTVKDNEYYYVINITDESSLKNVKITLDDEEKINEDINETTYSTEIKLQNNSSNKIIIEASNGNLKNTIKRQRPLPIN